MIRHWAALGPAAGVGGASRAETQLGPVGSSSLSGTSLCLPQSPSSSPRPWAEAGAQAATCPPSSGTLGEEGTRQQVALLQVVHHRLRVQKNIGFHGLIIAPEVHAPKDGEDVPFLIL